MHSGVLGFRKSQVKNLKDLECGDLKKPTKNMISCLYAQNLDLYINKRFIERVRLTILLRGR